MRSALRVPSRVSRTPARTAVRIGPVSFVRRPWSLGVCGVLAAAVLLLLCVNVGTGELSRSPWEVLKVLLGGGDTVDHLVIVEIRLPRSLVAVMAGAALGISGAIVQSVTRNGLASPDLLGVTTGASAAAVAVIVLGPGSAGWWALGSSGAAVAGGMFAGGLLFLLGWNRGLDTYRLVLVGIGVNFAFSALISLMLVRGQLNDAAKATVWLTGSLESRTWDHVWPLLGVLVVGAFVITRLGNDLASLRLGEDAARGLGVRLAPARLALLGTAVLLAAVAAAATGPVGFVAFVAPQVMKRVLRTAGEPVIGSAIGGALLLVGADVLSRAVVPFGLPVGIVTAVVGAPIFLHLLLRNLRTKDI